MRIQGLLGKTAIACLCALTAISGTPVSPVFANEENASDLLVLEDTFGEENPSIESSENGFVLPDDAVYEPGVVLLSVDTNVTADDLLVSLAKRDDIVVQGIEDVVDGVCKVRLAPDTSIEDGVNQLETLEGVILAQPDYVYPSADESEVQIVEEAATESKEQPSVLESSEQEEPNTDIVVTEELSSNDIESPVAETMSSVPETMDTTTDDISLTAQSTQPPTNDTYIRKQWGLDCIDVFSAWKQGFTGKGVCVAVIDSGFDINYRDMKGQYVGARNVRSDSTDVSGDEGHGKAVSSVIASKANNGFGLAGVAYNSTVMPIKADKYSSSNLIKAYDYILSNHKRYNVKIICTSFGSDWSSPTKADLLVSKKIDDAYAAGIVSVASAGNYGGTVNHCPADLLRTVGVMGLEYDGYSPQTFNAYDGTFIWNRVRRSEGSNFNAPGSTTKGIIAPGFWVPVFQNDDGSCSIQAGTSFAAPHVAGALALMFQANPNLTPSQAIDALYTTAKDMGSPGWDSFHGYGALDASKAVDAAIRAASSTNQQSNGSVIVTAPEVTQGISYRTHIQRKGWLNWVQDGNYSGTVGKSLRMEALQINLPNQRYSGSISYRAHVQRNGWEKTWRKDGEKSGTSKKSLRLEAIQIKLTGQLAEHYDVYYRVHCQRFGWMGWAKNGAQSGSAGYSRRLEAIQMVIVPKGQGTPAKGFGGAAQNTDRVFAQRR